MEAVEKDEFGQIKCPNCGTGNIPEKEECVYCGSVLRQQKLGDFIA